MPWHGSAAEITRAAPPTANTTVPTATTISTRARTILRARPRTPVSSFGSCDRRQILGFERRAAYVKLDKDDVLVGCKTVKPGGALGRVAGVNRK
jgi:hypothetical protein